jgi:hypothetical protein
MVGLLGLHVSGVAAFDPQPIPPGLKVHVAPTPRLWGGGVGDAPLNSIIDKDRDGSKGAPAASKGFEGTSVALLPAVQKTGADSQTGPAPNPEV